MRGEGGVWWCEVGNGGFGNQWQNSHTNMQRCTHMRATWPPGIISSASVYIGGGREIIIANSIHCNK